MRNDYQNDPDGFDEAYTTYINETVRLLVNIQTASTQIGLAYAGQNVAALTADKLEFEDSRDFKNGYSSIRQEIDDIAAYVLTAAIGQTAGMLDKDLMILIKKDGRIDQLVAKHGDRLGVTQAVQS